SGIGVPSGVIMMWSGSTSTIPAGWFLCNGSNGTPDLRNRFIVGAGSTYGVGATGGANEVTLTESQIPSHSHGRGTLVNSASGSHNHGGDTFTSGSTHTHNAGSGLST